MIPRFLSPHRSIFVALALIGLTLFAAGCTSRQDPAEYEDRVDKALSARDNAVEQLGGGRVLDEATYRTLRTQVQRALDELDSQAPPKDYVKGHEKMVDALDGLAVLLGKLARCQVLDKSSLQDARACRQSIGQDVFDTLRNDFAESDAIYRQEGLSLPALGGDEDDQTDTGGGGDVLSGS